MSDPNPYRSPSGGASPVENRRVGVLVVAALLALLLGATTITLIVIHQSRSTPQVDAVSSAT